MTRRDCKRVKEEIRERVGLTMGDLIGWAIDLESVGYRSAADKLRDIAGRLENWIDGTRE